MKAGIVLFPGINRERDMAIALERAAGHAPRMIWHTETDARRARSASCMPGGFCYGDYLRCGAMAAQSPVMGAVRAHAARGGYVLGVCNGFQILTEAGLLPGALLRNAGAALHLRRTATCGSSAPIRCSPSRYQRGAVFRAPMAHGDGNYFADAATLDRLEGEGLVAFRYATPTGEVTPAANRNGSARNIAGIYSPNLRVLGLMPHPEDLVDPLLGGTDGKPLFDSAGSGVSAPVIRAADEALAREFGLDRRRIRESAGDHGPPPSLTELGVFSVMWSGALLLQILPRVAETVADESALGDARAGRERRRGRDRRRAWPPYSKWKAITTRASSSPTRARRPASAASCATCSPWARARSPT